MTIRHGNSTKQRGLTSPAVRLFICLFFGSLIWVSGLWNEVNPQAWTIFSVFIAVILSFILKPYPMGMMVMIGLLILLVTGNLTIDEALSGFADSTVWLVVAAFLIAAAMISTGLGKRIALTLVVRLGKTIRGLAYAICGSELILATVVPSNTARGGGIHAPIVNSLSHSLDSSAESHPEKAGEYLTLVGSHANLIAAAMFMTGMAANPLVSKAVEEIYDIEFGWGQWALGALVPGLVSLAILPHLMYWLSKPTVDQSDEARAEAEKDLMKMGEVGRSEWIMLMVLATMLLLWSTKAIHGLGTTTVALTGVAVLLLTGAQTWKDVISNYRAWDTLVWLGGLLTMANMLLKYGFIEWFVGLAQHVVTDMSGVFVVIVLAVIYFYSMYGFSMLTAHIASMAAPFLAVCLYAGVEGLMAAAIFAYFSCLCGCTTNYSSGPVIIYFGLGYVTVPKWFKIGFIMSLVHLSVWIGLGLLWWKALGWW